MEKIKEIVSKHPQVFTFAGEKPAALVEKAEIALGVRLPKSYRDFLKSYGFISFEGLEYYGVIDEEFEKSGVPDVVWYNHHLRIAQSFPAHLIVVSNNDGVEYMCLDTSKFFSDTECAMVVWDNVSKKVAESYDISFADFLADEMEQALEIE
jgi:antitoxin YobK